MIHYPNGKPYTSKQASVATPQYGGRGMTLEHELNLTNRYYLATGQAVVYKKPTPIQIVKVDYPERSQAVIKEAYFKTPSTTDYNGVYRGYYLDFEAKETKTKTAFPLKNFHQHQIDHFVACMRQEGICFVVMRFVTLHRLFVYPASNLVAAWQTREQKRQSIPLATIQRDGFELTPKIQPSIPYLAGVDWLIETKVGKTHDSNKA